MSLHFLIDGYNVIKQADSLKVIRPLKDARVSLVKIIQAKRLMGSKNNQVTIVYDGKEDFNLLHRDFNNNAPIKVIFSKGESADETIKSIVSDSTNPKQMVVVTDDKAIIYFSRSLGAKVLSVGEFLDKGQKQLGSKAERQRGQIKAESLKIELTYQQQAAINQELRRFWK